MAQAYCNRNTRFLSCEKRIFLIIFFLGTAIRVASLPAQSVWSDEYVCVAFLNSPTWSEFHKEYKKYDPYMPPLYHALLFGSSKLVGKGAIPLRLLSLGFGLVAMIMIWLLGNELLGPRSALIPLTLFAFSPEQIYHAQGIRCYALVVLLGLCSTYTFVQILKRGGWFWWFSNALFNVLLVWTHLGGVILGVLWGLGILSWLRKNLAQMIVWGIIQIICTLPLLTIVFFTVNQQTAAAAAHSVHRSFFGTFLLVFIVPFFKDASYILNALPADYLIEAGITTTGEYVLKFFWFFLSLLLAFSLMTAFLITFLQLWHYHTKLLGVGLDKSVEGVHSCETNSKAPHIHLTLHFLLFWFLVPIALLIVPAHCINRMAISPRYTISVSPSLFFLTARGLGEITSRRIAYLVGGLLVGSMVILGIGTLITPMRGNYLAAGLLMESEGFETPIAVMGDSPLLDMQMAYNSNLSEQNIRKINTLQELEQWLDTLMLPSGKGWFMLEETHGLENPQRLNEIEDVLCQKKIIFFRKFFSGPQILIVYKLSGM